MFSSEVHPARELNFEIFIKISKTLCMCVLGGGGLDLFEKPGRVGCQISKTRDINHVMST